MTDLIDIAFQGARSWLGFLERESKNVARIVAVVQDNREFFNAGIGDSCLDVAATKLEQLVKENK